MRQAQIFYKDKLAGMLIENDEGYEFSYLPKYLSSETAQIDRRDEQIRSSIPQ